MRSNLRAGACAAIAFVFSAFHSGAGLAASDDLIQKGEYLARAANCVACHSTYGGEAFSGGLLMALPFGLGEIYATNMWSRMIPELARHPTSTWKRVSPGLRAAVHAHVPKARSSLYQLLETGCCCDHRSGTRLRTAHRRRTGVWLKAVAQRGQGR